MYITIMSRFFKLKNGVNDKMWLYYNVMYQVIICTKLLKKVNVSKFTLKKNERKLY